MSSKTFYKNYNYFTQKLKNFYKQNWFYIWLFIIIFISAFIFGITSVCKYKDSITKTNIIDVRFIEFVSGKISTFSLCFGYFAKYLFVLMLFLILCSSKVLSFFCYIIIAYLGYCLGINSEVIIIVFGFPGIMHIILCYVPFFILEVLLLAVIFCTFIMRQKCSSALCGRSYFSFEANFLKQILFFIIAGFLLFFIMSVVNSLTTSAIIIVI